MTLNYEQNKSLLSPSKAPFMQMSSDKKLELIGDLDKIFLEIMTFYDTIHFKETNLHYTDSEVRQFQTNIKSGLLSERDLVYYS